MSDVSDRPDVTELEVLGVPMAGRASPGRGVENPGGTDRVTGGRTRAHTYDEFLWENR